MDELYLDNIDEYINDHNKIVTYKWLSLTLGVHVNTAKQMLYHYLDHKRKESSAQLHATYLVSGKFVDNGQTSHKVSVVREEQLDDFKAKMKLIVSEHVYSVQKALLKDSGPLYSVDYDAVKDNLKNCNKYSAIRCANAVPMSSVELQQAREIQRAPTPEPETKKAVNGEAGVASKAPAKPQKGIMGMFSSKPKNQDSVKEVKAEPKEEAPAVEPPKSKAAGKANPMMNFFGSQASKKPAKTVKEEQETPPAQSSSSAEQQQKSSQQEEKPEVTAAEPKKDSRSSKSKRIIDSDSEEEKLEKKKRRRIKKPEPDSSDEDVIPDSPQKMEAREKSPSPTKELKSVTHSHQEDTEMKIRRRRKVLKSKNFVDEDGCMVTEKVYESESYSETEDDFQAPKQAARDPFKAKQPSSSKDNGKKSQKKVSSSTNSGTKQASIMGFFQKK